MSVRQKINKLKKKKKKKKNYAADQKNRPARKTMITGQLSISWTLL